jgi:hypothetical protein
MDALNLSKIAHSKKDSSARPKERNRRRAAKERRSRSVKEVAPFQPIELHLGPNQGALLNALDMLALIGPAASLATS